MRNSRMSYHGKEKHAEFDSSVMDGTASDGGSVRSPMYTQISNIPSGRYGTARQQQTIEQLLQQVMGTEDVATMPSDLLAKKMQSQF